MSTQGVGLCGVSLREQFLLTLVVFLVAALVGRAGDNVPSNIPASLRLTNHSTNYPPDHFQDKQKLEPGTALERSLASGTKDSYVLTLVAGEFVHIKAEQQGIDLVLAITGPDGQQLLQIDSPNGLWGPEAISLVAPVTGDYQVDIRSSEKAVAAGNYRLSAERISVPGPEENNRIQAERAFIEGQKLRQAKYESAEKKREALNLALNKYHDALNAWTNLQDEDARAKALVEIARTYRDLPRKDAVTDSLNRNQAIDYFQQSLSLRQRMDDPLGEGYSLNEMGRFYLGIDQPRNALASYTKALETFRTLKETRNVAAALNNIGLAHHFLNELEEASKNYNEALTLWQQVNNLSGQTIALNNLAGVSDLLGDKAGAIERYQKVLAIVQSIGDQGMVANTLNNLGKAQNDLGRWDLALDAYQRALQIWETSPPADVRKKAALLNNIGILYNALGDLPEALRLLKEALSIEQESNAKRDEGYTLADIGYVYLTSGNPTAAKQYLERSIVLRKEVSDSRGQASSVTFLGMVLAETGDPNGAMQRFQEAMAIWAPTDAQGRAFTLNRMGRIQISLGNSQLATQILLQALGLAKTIAHSDWQSAILLDLAKLHRDQANSSEALEEVKAALDLVESIRNRGSRGDLRTTFLASKQEYYEVAIDLMMRLHRLNPAERYDQMALQTSERRRARSLLDTLTEAHADIRRGSDPALLAREKTARQQLDAAAARQLRLLAGKHTAQEEQTLTAQIQKIAGDHERIESEIRASSPLYAALSQPVPLTTQEVQQMLDQDTLLLEYSLGRERSFVWTVSRDSINSFELPASETIEDAARRVYAALTERNREEKNESQLRRRARLDKAQTDYADASAQLSKMVLEPVSSLLGQKRLVVVTDGALQLVPFSALPAQATPSTAGNSELTANSSRTIADRSTLLGEHEIVTLPSASVLALQRRELANRKPAPYAVAVLADPVFDLQDVRVARATGIGNQHRKDIATTGQTDETLSKKSWPDLSALSSSSNQSSQLPRALRDVGLNPDGQLRRLSFSRREATSIARAVPAYQSFSALDFKASRQTATSTDLSKYRIIHFATHGVLDLEHPELSGIVLSMVDEKGQPQDGYLRLHEIYNLNLPAELVVLSACQTGIGKEIKGEGLIALTRGFMYAGAKSVVASLWQVDDAATSALMAEFYKQMFTYKLKPAPALRAAQIHMSKQKRWQSPYYWAGFFIQGEWN